MALSSHELFHKFWQGYASVLFIEFGALHELGYMCRDGSPASRKVNSDWRRWQAMPVGTWWSRARCSQRQSRSAVTV